MLPQFILETMPEHMREIASDRAYVTDMGIITTPLKNGFDLIVAVKFNLWDCINGIVYQCTYYYETKVLEFVAQ